VELESGYRSETLHHMALEKRRVTPQALKDTVHDADQPEKPIPGNSNDSILRIPERQPHSQ
jgi:hypothetical protein